MQSLIATTFEVVHYIALQAVHYKPLQEVHLSRYNHFSKGETCFRSMWLKRLVSREAIDNVDEYSDRYLEEQPEARLDELDHGNPMSFHTIRTSFCRMVFPFISPKVSHCVLSRPMVSQCINNLGMFGWAFAVEMQ